MLPPQEGTGVAQNNAESCSKSKDNKEKSFNQPKLNKTAKKKTKVVGNQCVTIVRGRARKIVKSQPVKNECVMSNQVDDASGLVTEDNENSFSSRPKRLRTNSGKQELQQGVSEENENSISNRPKRLRMNPSMKQEHQEDVYTEINPFVSNRLRIISTGKREFQPGMSKKNENSIANHPMLTNFTKNLERQQGVETEEQQGVPRSIKQNKMKQKSKKETNEVKDKRRQQQKERGRQRILAETAEQREKRLEYMRERQKQRIQSETPEERSQRLKRMRAYQPKTEKTEKRLEYMRERQKQRIQEETFEERSKRLEKMRLYQRKRSGKPKRRKVTKKTGKDKNESIRSEKKESNIQNQIIHSESLDEMPLKLGRRNVYQPFKARKYGLIQAQSISEDPVLSPDEHSNFDVEDPLDLGSQDDQYWDDSGHEEIIPDPLSFSPLHIELIKAEPIDIDNH